MMPANLTKIQSKLIAFCFDHYPIIYNHQRFSLSFSLLYHKYPYKLQLTSIIISSQIQHLNQNTNQTQPIPSKPNPFILQFLSKSITPTILPNINLLEFIINLPMEKDRDPHLYLFNNILDDDKEVVKKQINTSRNNNNYSAPPSITLYDYDELEREILGEDNEEVEDVCTKLPLPSPKKLPKKHKYSFDAFDEIGSTTLSRSQSAQPQNSAEYKYPYYQYNYMQMGNYMQIYQPPSHKQIHNSIMQVLKYTNEMAKEKNNSKTLQYYFENSSEQDKDLIFRQLFSEALLLAKDPYGNYVIQKVLEIGLKTHKQQLFQLYKISITDLSLNSYGCRVVQRIIQSLYNHQIGQQQLIQQIAPYINNLIVDQNGNHVIQKIFQYFTVQNTKNVAENLLSNIQVVAFHAYGCRVLQKFIQKGSGSLVFKNILTKLISLMLPLCKCLYGNYIMQYLVVHGPLQERNSIFSNIKTNFVFLSLNKFASNVVQKAVINCNHQYRKQILKILKTPYAEDCNSSIGFVVLAKGQYSNYVIQRYLQCSTRQIQEQIMSLIPEGSQNFNTIKESQYGRHVLSQLQKYR